MLSSHPKEYIIYGWINEKHSCAPSLFYVHAITYYPNCQNCISIRKYFSNMLLWFNIQIQFFSSLSVSESNSGQTVSCTRKYCMKWNCHNLHNYTHIWFTCHCTLLYMKIFLHRYESIQQYIPSIHITSPVV